jgi:protoheme IX farnesyltransferase
VTERNNLKMYRSIRKYIEVLKPKETSLLIFIGALAAVVAGEGSPPLGIFLLSLVAIALGSGGANGLTNYLDRDVDARMQRTQHRALPSRRISPPRKVLPLVVSLVAIALAMAWILHPMCFLFGAIGVVAALSWRKTWATHLLGIISGCAPVLVGYLAINHQLNLTILHLCLLIAAWVPLHVWSLMISHRDDYLRAGVRIFPVTWETKDAIKVLVVLAVLLYGISIALYRFGNFGIPYLVVANILGIAIVIATFRLLFTGISQDAWRVYKLTAFPYLGLIFFTMGLDLWLV